MTFIILMYHKISERRSDFINTLDIGTFNNQIDFVKNFYEIISVEDIFNGSASKNRKTKVIITFDDGYKCFYQYAYPILKRHKIPATMFLTVDSIENNTPIWPDLINLYFGATKEERVELNFGINKLNLLITDLKSRIEASNAVKEILKKTSNQECLFFIEQLRKQLKVGKTIEKMPEMLTWDEINEMSQNNITFGGHTMTHPILTQLPLEVVRYEVTESKKIIERNLGKTITAFAYPNGEPSDFNKDIGQVLKEAGYLSACTTIFGGNRPDTDPFELRRVYTSGNSQLKFILRLQRAR